LESITKVIKERLIYLDTLNWYKNFKKKLIVKLFLSQADLFLAMQVSL